MDLKGICYKMNIIEKENKELEELKQSKKYYYNKCLYKLNKNYYLNSGKSFYLKIINIIFNLLKKKNLL
ncbi:hypothetical protein CYK68_08425 [Clostridium perfringens]|nr:hypothetical protein CYK68_08425 [Clostridium perfringens]